MKKKKTAVLVYKTRNIGDDIQTLAAKQFLKKVNHMIERERIGEFESKNPVKIILNGWFADREIAWPPKNNLIPLFISFHLNENKKAYKKFCKKNSKKYFKQFEPIGCRDYSTVKLFRRMGIDAYFTGCLTLTLNLEKKKKTGNIYFVDIPLEIREIIIGNSPENLRNKIKTLTHECKSKDIAKRHKLAKELLKKYASAKLVITSRLHCALPSLAFKTPVIFIPPFPGDPRFDGLKELLKVYNQEDIQTGKVKIDIKNPITLKSDISLLKANLEKRVREFLKDG